MTTTTAEDYQAEVERLRKEASEAFLLDFSLEQADLDLVEPRVFEAPHCWTWADMFSAVAADGRAGAARARRAA